MSLPPRKALSAARAAPLRRQATGPLKERLAAGASNAALNTAAVLREFLDDFRQQSRYFKYKVLIVASWAVLSITSVGIACPEQALSAGDLGARLVVAGEDSRPIVMLLNEGDEAWQNVTVVVNKTYRASVSRVEATGQLTLTPKQLMGPAGLAPAGLRITDVELRTDDGDVTLMSDGELP